jgi:glycerol-1-phosphate dehydrogenase [NAD(P)+]
MMKRNLPMRSLLEKYCNMNRMGSDGKRYRTQTHSIFIEPGICSRIGEIAPRYLDMKGTVGIIADDNTLKVAGTQVITALDNVNMKTNLVLLPPAKHTDHVVCDDATLDWITGQIKERQLNGVIAVGSGTISDLAKMSAHRLNIPSLSVATAPSNNGFTSAIAAILSRGVKTTQPCTPAISVIADPIILAQAPYRMIASGLGDLYSKPVSNADWRLSYRLNDTFFSPIVMEIVDAGNALLDGVAPRLPSRDIEAVARLTGAIMLSGLGMQAAGSSGPASGGEHLVSHYLDMTAKASGEAHDLHGCQVAVGTVITASLYDRLKAVHPASIDVSNCVNRLLPWPKYANIIQSRFGPLTDAVMQHAEPSYPTKEQLESRLSRLVEDWEDIMDWVGETLRPPEALTSELVSADCPVQFPQIGVSKSRAIRAVIHSKDIRNRYTVLHLLWELGLLEPWATEMVEKQFVSH